MLHADFSPTYNNLQIALSYDTDLRFKLYCLPGLITKKYLNTKILKGQANSYIFDDEGNLSKVENEVLIARRKFSLYARQLYDLFDSFEEHGEITTFQVLSDHASYIAYRKLFPTYKLSSYAVKTWLLLQQVDSSLHQLASEAMTNNHHLSLTETVTAQTLFLFGYEKKSELNN